MGIADILQPFASSITYICVLVIATFAITLIFKTSTTTNFAQSSIAVFGCYFGTSFYLKNTLEKEADSVQFRHFGDQNILAK